METVINLVLVLPLVFYLIRIDRRITRLDVLMSMVIKKIGSTGDREN